jgi:hypothetical protein
MSLNLKKRFTIYFKLLVIKMMNTFKKLFFLLTLIISLTALEQIQGKQDFIRLGANDKGDGPGMFSCVLTTIGLADMYEKGEYPGFIVDYVNQGAYYDPEISLNWWNYYYSPVCVGKKVEKYRKATTSERIKFSKHAEFTLSRKRCYQLIQKYIKIKPAVNAIIEEFADKHFDEFVIGIHYRGTDKKIESPRINYEQITAKIKDVCHELSIDSPKIFVATDEEAFLEYMQNYFPNRVIAYDAIKSKNGVPVHLSKANKYKKGEDAIVDCLLLSKCDYLIRTNSNLSLCSGLFNPNIPMFEVRKK